MKNLLTCDINRRTHMSHDPRHRCAEGRAAQSGSHPTPRARATARGCRTLGPGLVHLQAPSLSLSPAGSATETTGSRRRCQSLFYGQAFAPSGGNAPDVRRLDRIDFERDRQPSVAGGPASWGRPSLTARQVGHARCGWNINLIGCGRRNWPRLMNAWCRTISGLQARQLPHRPQATRRF
jgi:hypothetical protein